MGQGWGDHYRPLVTVDIDRVLLLSCVNVEGSERLGT